MKLLLFSDLHCDTKAAERLVAQAAQVDVVIGAGDFGNIRRGLNITIDILRQITKPSVLVAGNSESTEELVAACQAWPMAQVLHGSGLTIEGVSFYGIGGGIPVTPFGAWSYDFSEVEAEGLMANCPLGGILVSHSPPKGAVDRTSSGQSIGSTAIRAIVERQRPQLVVCGHIHGSAGQQATIGKTVVINAGPAGIVWQVS